MSDIHALTGAYVVDALEPAERELVEQHLATCADCRAEVESLREAAAMLPEITASAPPPGLRDRVLADISRVRPLPPVIEPPVVEPRVVESPVVEPAMLPTPAAVTHAEPVSLASRRRRFRPAMAAAAAVVALIGGGVVASQPWDDGSTQQTELSAAERAERVVQDPDAQRVRKAFPDGASATVVRSTSEGRAVLLTKRMPPAPDGKVYELWLQKDGVMVPAGLMPDKADQTVLLEGDANGATAVGITVEPDGGSAKPTSAPIAMFALEAA